MKTIYVTLAVLFLSFSSCKNFDAANENSDDSIDSTAIQQNVETTDSLGNMVDTTATMTDTTGMTSTEMNSEEAKSNVKLPNRISTTEKVIPGEKGKFPLAETKWELVEINGKAIEPNKGRDYFINFDSKTGTFRSFVGCNRISGNYFMKSPNNKLGFTNVISTRKACNDNNLERDFFNNLQKTDNYMIDDKMLHLHIGKKAIAKFKAVR